MRDTRKLKWYHNVCKISVCCKHRSQKPVVLINVMESTKLAVTDETNCTFCTCCIVICLVCFVASFMLYFVYYCWLTVYCCSWLGCVVILNAFVVLRVHCFFFTLNAGLLATGQYSEGRATGHFDTGFSRFPCAEKQMLRWFPRFQVVTTCFSCSPPDLNLVVTNFMFCLHVK